MGEAAILDPFGRNSPFWKPLGFDLHFFAFAFIISSPFLLMPGVSSQGPADGGIVP